MKKKISEFKIFDLVTLTHTDHILQQKVKTNRGKSAATVKAELENKLKVIISESTICRRLLEVGLYDRVARKKPYGSKVNGWKSLEYAKNYREKPSGFWNKVFWSDESKFNLFVSDGKVIVWCSSKDEFEPESTIPTVKHSGDNVKRWICFSWAGVDSLIFIDGNMTGELYRAILENNLLKSVGKSDMSHGWIFQHDNDPKHRAAIAANLLNTNGMK